MKDFIFTSESVSEGHPDKIADQISDSILDAILQQDPTAKVACETAVNTGFAMIFGEITTTAKVDFIEVARKKVADIGYDDPRFGYPASDIAVMVALDKQSPDIAQGVRTDLGVVKEQGAGDQGLMFGFACDHTDVLMPMPIVYAHRLMERLAYVRKNKIVPFFGPDAKSQVSIRYEKGEPKDIDAIVVSTQHYDSATLEQVKEAIFETVIKEVIPPELLTRDTKFHINPTGRFVIGGPKGDAGLTGRKIIVDTYGGWGRHGGGAFSGKDASKVDRSAAYMARYIAKNVVAAGLARTVEVQLAYAIGVAEPVSIMVNTFGTNAIAESEIEDRIVRTFDLRPAAITETLQLLSPQYTPTAAYGHFGREGFHWEKTDLVDELREP